MLTLNDKGCSAFSYLKNGQTGKREVYFINKINTGSVTGATMLLGQFIFEFEGAPDEALLMRPGGTNRIYFPTDSRIRDYDFLKKEEKDETKSRLSVLLKKYPEHTYSIKGLMRKIK